MVQETCAFVVLQPMGMGRGQHAAGNLGQKEASSSKTSREKPDGGMPQWALPLYKIE